MSLFFILSMFRMQTYVSETIASPLRLLPPKSHTIFEDRDPSHTVLLQEGSSTEQIPFMSLLLDPIIDHFFPNTIQRVADYVAYHLNAFLGKNREMPKKKTY